MHCNIVAFGRVKSKYTRRPQCRELGTRSLPARRGHLRLRIGERFLGRLELCRVGEVVGELGMQPVDLPLGQSQRTDGLLVGEVGGGVGCRCPV